MSEALLLLNGQAVLLTHNSPNINKDAQPNAFTIQQNRNILGRNVFYPEILPKKPTATLASSAVEHQPQIQNVPYFQRSTPKEIKPKITSSILDLGLGKKVELISEESSVISEFLNFDNNLIKQNESTTVENTTNQVNSDFSNSNSYQIVQNDALVVENRFQDFQNVTNNTVFGNINNTLEHKALESTLPSQIKQNKSNGNEASSLLAIIQVPDGSIQTVQLSCDDINHLSSSIPQLKNLKTDSTKRTSENDILSLNGNVSFQQKNVAVSNEIKVNCNNINSDSMQPLINGKQSNFIHQNVLQKNIVYNAASSSNETKILPDKRKDDEKRNIQISYPKTITSGNARSILNGKPSNGFKVIGKVTHLESSPNKSASQYSSLLFSVKNDSNSVTSAKEIDSEDAEVDVCTTDSLDPPLIGQNAFNWNDLAPKPKPQSRSKQRTNSKSKNSPKKSKQKKSSDNTKKSSAKTLTESMTNGSSVNSTKSLENKKSSHNTSADMNSTTTHHNTSIPPKVIIRTGNLASTSLINKNFIHDRMEQNEIDPIKTIKITTGSLIQKKITDVNGLSTHNKEFSDCIDQPSISLSNGNLSATNSADSSSSMTSIIYSSASDDGEPYSVQLPGGDSRKPLGSSENPIQLVQKGHTFQALQPIQEKHIEQITSLLQQRKIRRGSSVKDELFDPNTNMRIVYRLINPDDLTQTSLNNPEEILSDDDDEDIDVEVTVLETEEEKEKRLKESLYNDNKDLMNKGSDRLNVDILDINTEKSKVKRPLASRTRSGRISRPPKHMLKDFDHLPPGNFDKDDQHATLGYREYEGDLLNEQSTVPSLEQLPCKYEFCLCLYDYNNDKPQTFPLQDIPDMEHTPFHLHTHSTQTQENT